MFLRFADILDLLIGTVYIERFGLDTMIFYYLSVVLFAVHYC